MPFTGRAAATAYQLSWPADYEQGTFTLDVGTAFTTYSSTTALGTYGGPDGLSSEAWTEVELQAQPDFTELRLYFGPGEFVGYAVSPSYIGQASPFTSAAEAWQDLISAGARDGVNITVVPEPGCGRLWLAGLPLLWMAGRRATQGNPLLRKARVAGHAGSNLIQGLHHR